MDEKILKPTRLQGTRWMRHLHQSIKCMFKSFDVILNMCHKLVLAKPQLRPKIKYRLFPLSDRLTKIAATQKNFIASSEKNVF
jgi:hypothetical protein